MSDPKEFNEANERELEQVSGGSWEHWEDGFFRCPNCECESRVYTPLSVGESGPSCPKCKYDKGIEVIMTRVR